jgi:hypothetical protein
MMNLLPSRVLASPLLIRTVPFLVFLLLTFAQSYGGAYGRYWLYLAKTIVGAWMIWEMRPRVAEMRWKISMEAVVAGVLVFLIWVGWPELFKLAGMKPEIAMLKSSGPAWNPTQSFGEGFGLAWLFILVRIAGSTLVVPPLEEVFFRSFVYRYIRNANFESVPLGAFAWIPFLVTSVLFGFEHREWLAGILAGIVFQGLVCWKKRLGDAITAHAVTNFLLGVWVIWKHEWQYW